MLPKPVKYLRTPGVASVFTPVGHLGICCRPSIEDSIRDHIQELKSLSFNRDDNGGIR